MDDAPVDTKLTVNESDSDVVCGACLMELFTPDHEFIGSPAGCPHLFHWDCLRTWSELQNTCPQCKLRFRVAGKYHSSDRAFVECAKFKKRDRVGRASENEPVELPVEVCEKCNCPGNDDEMILCDGMDYTCNAQFHYKCVGFDSVPAGLWFCDRCIEKGFIPEELKQTMISQPSSPKPKKRKSTMNSSPTRSKDTSPIIMPPPQLFPRQLVVQVGVNRTSTSSGLPRNLLQPLQIPVVAPPTDSVSVFARFRQRRLELKKAQTNH